MHRAELSGLCRLKRWQKGRDFIELPLDRLLKENLGCG